MNVVGMLFVIPYPQFNHVFFQILYADKNCKLTVNITKILRNVNINLVKTLYIEKYDENKSGIA